MSFLNNWIKNTNKPILLKEGHILWFNNLYFAMLSLLMFPENELLRASRVKPTKLLAIIFDVDVSLMWWFHSKNAGFDYLENS